MSEPSFREQIVGLKHKTVKQHYEMKEGNQKEEKDQDIISEKATRMSTSEFRYVSTKSQFIASSDQTQDDVRWEPD